MQPSHGTGSRWLYMYLDVAGALIHVPYTRDNRHRCLFLKLAAKNGCLFSQGAYIYGVL